MATLSAEQQHHPRQKEEGSAGSMLESNEIHTNDECAVYIVGEGSMATR
jgi:hypothetical protein